MTTDERIAAHDARTEALSRAIEALPEIAQEMVYRWRGRIEMAGRAYHGSALRSLEEFVASITAIVGSTQGEIENLQGIVRSLADRVATQSEVLTRAAMRKESHHGLS